MIIYKICPTCKQNLVSTAFYPSKRYRNGLSYQCKVCYSLKNKEHRQKIIERNLELGNRLYKNLPSSKKCSGCQQELSTKQFYRTKTTRDGFRQYCKDCDKKNCQKYQQNHKDKMSDYRKQYSKKHKEQITIYMQEYGRNWRYKNKYGITNTQREKMFQEQGGKCAICNCYEGKKKLAIDHNHQTGQVRALLCDRCNFILGCSKESEEILNAAIQYLKKFENSIALDN